jgi:hypothetical protein
MDDPTKRADLAAFLNEHGGDVGSMSHSDLYRLRALSPPEEQPSIAPLEHRAFAREWTQDNPVLGVGMPLAALGYYLAKKTGAIQSRTPADMDQVFGAVQGTLQGYGLADK